jgi:hypothetical protein
MAGLQSEVPHLAVAGVLSCRKAERLLLAGAPASPVMGDVSSCRAAWVKGPEFTRGPQAATLTQHAILPSPLGKGQGVSLRWGRIPPLHEHMASRWGSCR